MTPPLVYRTRTKTVEARQVNGMDREDCREIAQWCGGEVLDLEDHDTSDLAVIFVPQLDRGEDQRDGTYADNGDWVVHYRSGDFRVYTDASFKANFDPAVIL